MRPLFLDRPYDHIGAARTSYDRVGYAYGGTHFKRPATLADRVARVVTLLLVFAALGVALAGCALKPACPEGRHPVVNGVTVQPLGGSAVVRTAFRCEVVR